MQKSLQSNKFFASVSTSNVTFIILDLNDSLALMLLQNRF